MRINKESLKDFISHNLHSLEKEYIEEHFNEFTAYCEQQYKEEQINNLK